jgi:hypothetical protein
MEQDIVHIEPVPWDGRAFKESFEGTLALLEKLMQMQPLSFKREVYVVEQSIVQLRDSLIGRLRGLNASNEKTRLSEILNRVNIAVSLIVALEYPAGGIQQELLQQIYDFLKDAQLEDL